MMREREREKMEEIYELNSELEIGYPVDISMKPFQRDIKERFNQIFVILSNENY